VVLSGTNENGFSSVTYAGTSGWAYRDYIVPSASVVDGVGFDPIFFGRARTTADLNLRAGPSTSEDVLMVIPNSTWVEISNGEKNGFRFVSFNGRLGWSYDDFLSWPGDGAPLAYLTTTVALNFRAEPNLSARILEVLAAGTRVQATSEVADGLRKVVHNGTTGWAYGKYLS
jgi:D-alanyl-D-alanine carboxypeptidase